MSQRRQIVLPDPVDQQLRELAAGADTPPSTLAAQMVQARRRARQPRTARSARCAPRRCSSAATAASARPGLSPTAATASGASRCGAPSSRCTAATRRQLASAQRQMVDRRITHRDAVRARRLASRTRRRRPGPARRARLPEPARRLLPTSCASKAAASPRHGSPVRHRRSGPRSSRPTSLSVTSLAASVSASCHTHTRPHRLGTVGLKPNMLAPATALTALGP